MKYRCIWQAAADKPITLSQDDVHLWKLQLDLATTELKNLEKVLTVEEGNRANAFHFERERTTYVAAHGQLRMILSRYTKVEPSAVTFSYELGGKPSIVQSSKLGKLNFNLSHSEDLGLVAITIDRDLGVDVEKIQPMEDLDTIASMYFSKAELAALRALPPSSKLRFFLTLWTCKEAYLKATGKGLAESTSSFEIVFNSEQRAKLMSNGAASAESQAWSIEIIDPAPEYVGAVAVKGSDCILSCWHL